MVHNDSEMTIEEVKKTLTVEGIHIIVAIYRGVDNYSVWGGISSISVMGGSSGDVSENL